MEKKEVELYKMMITKKTGKQYELVKKVLKRYGKNAKTILDVGCGSNQYRNCFGDKKKYMGIDRCCDKYPGGFPDVLSTAEILPVKNNCIDLVFCVASFYFLNDQKSFLREVKRVMTEKGLLIIFNYKPKILKNHDKKFGSLKRKKDTQASFKRKLKLVGLKSMKIEYDTSWLIENKKFVYILILKLKIFDFFIRFKSQWMILSATREKNDNFY